MPPADGTQGARIAHAFRCDACKAPTRLSDLNDDMLCVACGELGEDPADFIDTSDAEMRREHSTWRL